MPVVDLRTETSRRALRGRACLMGAGATVVVLSAAALVASARVPAPVVEPPSPGVLVIGPCAAGPFRAADDIVRAEQSDYFDIARRAYEQGLASNPGDFCATRGLVALEAIESRVAAAARTPLESAQAGWKAFLDGWLTPTSELLAVVGGLVALALFLSWLVPPLVVRPSSVVGGLTAVVAAWTGAALVLWGALVPVLAFSGGAVQLAAGARAGVAVCLLAAAVVLLSESWHGWSESRGRRGLVAALVGLAAGNLLLSLVPRAGPGVLVAAVWSACLCLLTAGAALIGLWRGARLGLLVSVTTAAGSDGPASQLLLARLSELGSRRPTGIRVPAATDVSSLPEDALSAGPTGSWAKVLFALVRLVRPSTPWALDVSVTPGRSAVIMMRRNGVALPDCPLVVRRAQLLLEPPSTSVAAVADGSTGASKDGDTGEELDHFVTAAAAFALLQLSSVHGHLQVGLCGAHTWQALAHQAVASRPEVSADRRRRLLVEAVEYDHEYALARLALVNTLAKTTRPERERFARELSGLLHTFGSSGRGYEAMKLRLLFNVAAAHFNVWLMSEGALSATAEEDQLFWHTSKDAARKLVDALEPAVATPELRPLAQQLVFPAFNLVRDLSSNHPSFDSPVPLAPLRRALGDLERLDVLTPRSSRDYYSLAALEMSQRPLPPEKSDSATSWLQNLERAASVDLFRDFARIDPSFTRLRTAPGVDEPTWWHERYKETVGKPAITTVDQLPEFTGHGEVLKKAGVSSLARLAKVPVKELSRAAHVPRATARRWKKIAELSEWACREDEDEDDRLDLLRLLLEAGISSRQKLEAAMLEDSEALYERLVANARDTRLVPLRSQTIHRWARLLTSQTEATVRRVRQICAAWVAEIPPSSNPAGVSVLRQFRVEGVPPSDRPPADGSVAKVIVSARVLLLADGAKPRDDANWASGLLQEFECCLRDHGFSVSPERADNLVLRLRVS